MRTAEVKILEMGYSLECVSCLPQLHPDEKVLVEKDDTLYLGMVVGEVKIIHSDEAMPFAEGANTAGMPSIIRKLFPYETGDKYIRYPVEREGFDFCRKNAVTLNLSMKLLMVKYVKTDNKLIFYYSAEERVDFRELVKILASRFHLRIEMRQINVRDECKILGGIGICGRSCCCASVVNEMNNVTSKITKMQCQNTSKYVGYCGRLLCCIAFDPPGKDECVCEDAAEENDENDANPENMIEAEAKENNNGAELKQEAATDSRNRNRNRGWSVKPRNQFHQKKDAKSGGEGAGGGE